MPEGRILIVDDEEDILISLKLFLSRHFSYVQTEKNPVHILRILRQQKFDLILLDMNFKKGVTSGQEGLQWLQKIKQQYPNQHVIVISAYAEVKTAVEAVKFGATDFIEKPWRNEKLLTTVLSAFQLSQTKKTLADLEDKQRGFIEANNTSTSRIIGESKAMKNVFSLINKVAITDANVLVLGENGTGKEEIARAIHKKSSRSKQAFVKVDLGALPDSLFESELFGHVKGAFTDAKQDRMGRFELASGGTIFLDEIANVPVALQAKLLSVLQNRTISRIGSNKKTTVDVRLICATNVSLQQLVQERKFRQDLLYRINTVEVLLPPLRERTTDIPLLAEHFLEFYVKKYKKNNVHIEESALVNLQRQDWPGNVRELRHAIERAVILCDGKIIKSADFIGATGAKNTPATELESYNLEHLEKWAIRKAMTKYAGNISKAAEELGLTRATLYRKMDKYNL